ncbi:pyruvate dehydrogenase complex dihydrolipoamide acetyltransferase component (E2) [Paecilomyces lecythidis]|uniref:Pyruvate dehydrogenase complex dihydrolipoamide acetyltransferase component (E2) n=1 Tax=Paecilomyces lecythidis TaxID=3004212 RepID=A0ABR3Y5Z2_9EURO
MSYAAAAAKGPKQSPEDARAPPPPEVEKKEAESTVNLIDVDSPHVASVPPDFEEQKVKTTTQAERLEREAQEKYEAEKKKAEEAAEKAKAKAKSAAGSFRRNEDNPVILGNALLVTAITGGLGYGAYRKHLEGQLSWKLVGIWGGAVGALAVADYFVSK